MPLFRVACVKTTYVLEFRDVEAAKANDVRPDGPVVASLVVPRDGGIGSTRVMPRDEATVAWHLENARRAGSFIARADLVERLGLVEDNSL